MQTRQSSPPVDGSDCWGGWQYPSPRRPPGFACSRRTRRIQCLCQNLLVSVRGTSQEFLCPRGPGCCCPIRLPSGSSGPIPQADVEWVVEAVVRIPCPGVGSTDTGSTVGGLSKTLLVGSGSSQNSWVKCSTQRSGQWQAGVDRYTSFPGEVQLRVPHSGTGRCFREPTWLSGTGARRTGCGAVGGAGKGHRSPVASFPPNRAKANGFRVNCTR